MPGERLVNDYGTTLAAPLLASAGPGSAIQVGDPCPVIGRFRVRAFDPVELHSEFILVESLTPLLWQVVTRQAEDGDRFPVRSWPAGTPLEGMLTAQGLLEISTPDKSHTHHQSVPATDVLIVHNLGKYPSVTVQDYAGTIVGVRVEYVDANSLWVRTGVLFSFKAHLN